MRAPPLHTPEVQIDDVQRVIASCVSKLALRRDRLARKLEEVEAWLEQLKPIAIGIFSADETAD
jgi:hypothetical protein